MNTESKILIGLAVGVVGVGVVYALTRSAGTPAPSQGTQPAANGDAVPPLTNGDALALAPAYSPSSTYIPPRAPKNWTVELTAEGSELSGAIVGDTITVNTPHGEPITRIQADAAGVISAPPPSGAGMALLTIISTGSTSVDIDWGFGTITSPTVTSTLDLIGQGAQPAAALVTLAPGHIGTTNVRVGGSFLLSTPALETIDTINNSRSSVVSVPPVAPYTVTEVLITALAAGTTELTIYWGGAANNISSLTVVAQGDANNDSAFTRMV